MKTLLFVAALMLAAPAAADSNNSPAEDAYVACVVGRAFVALGNQEGKTDASAAMEEAFKFCPEPPEGPEGNDGLSDYVNMVVDDMASGVWPAQ